MKSTGIVRKVDELGRVVIPIELRRIFDIGVKDSVEIFTENDTIILRSYKPSCYICSSGKELRIFKNKKICIECIKESQKLI